MLNLVGMSAEVGAMRPRAWIGTSSASPSEGRIQPGQSRRLLLIIRPARPTLAEVPLADLSLGQVADGTVAGGPPCVAPTHQPQDTCGRAVTDLTS